MVRVPAIEPVFPQLLVGRGYDGTSPEDMNYNCIGHAMGTKQFWWPVVQMQVYWPPNVPLALTVDAFTQAFATRGYEVCGDGTLEPKYEKVALFALAGVPTHAALQLPSGMWTSKLGRAEDIEHELHGVANGGGYGTVVRYFRRRRPGAKRRDFGLGRVLGRVHAALLRFAGGK